ncbi:hypothetical protein H6B07_00855 [Mediterraneibacter glycyrrhizinilyticus]|nr:hypothetical protein [Mediterraneibacter glycyrrhizinilyticus]MBM6801228.1 hypothetical protein [Mediterraneibacter glycyrrhizinilyticus]
MEEIKQHCEKVIQILRSDYSTQLQYSGIIKKIYDVMLQIYGVHVEQQKRDTIDENGIPAL